MKVRGHSVNVLMQPRPLQPELNPDLEEKSQFAIQYYHLR